MKALTQPKIILLLATLFVAGGVVGAVGGFNYGRRSFMRTITAPPRPNPDMVQHILEKLQRDLALTDAQVTSTRPIVTEQVKQMDEVHGESMKRFGAIINAADEQIKKLLTADQLKLWDEMKARDRERRERGPRGPGSHGPPGGPGPWQKRGTNSESVKPGASLAPSGSYACNRSTEQKPAATGD